MDSPLTMEQAIASEVYRDLSTPKLALGEDAFDFELPVLDLRSGIERETGVNMRLADFRGRKPVALIFGSYT
ncbi:MAG: hypothetical protein LC685_00210 [Actinobacteria bacterium]|nr:hypothetical protein [Actinomycetota bacterium]